MHSLIAFWKTKSRAKKVNKISGRRGMMGIWAVKIKDLRWKNISHYIGIGFFLSLIPVLVWAPKIHSYAFTVLSSEDYTYSSFSFSCRTKSCTAAGSLSSVMTQTPWRRTYQSTPSTVETFSGTAHGESRPLSFFLFFCTASNET